MPLRVLIADDEESARDRLRQFCSEEEEVEIVAECGDGAETLAAIRKLAPDLVFLDIRMPELSGLEVVQALESSLLPAVVFVTAYDSYAIEAFEICAVDYLLKPFDRERFKKALLLGRERVSRQKLSPESRDLQELLARLAPRRKIVERLAVRSDGKVTLVNVAEIDWIRGAGNYAELHLGKTVHHLRQTLSSLETSLPRQFIRISKSLFVNIARVRELRAKSHGDSLVLLKDGTELAATRNFRENLKRNLKY